MTVIHGKHNFWWWFNPSIAGHTWMHTQYCSYWWPNAKALGHQYLQCWLNIHWIVSVSYKNITVVVNNTRRWNHILQINDPVVDPGLTAGMELVRISLQRRRVFHSSPRISIMRAKQFQISNFSFTLKTVTQIWWSYGVDLWPPLLLYWFAWWWHLMCIYC